MANYLTSLCISSTVKKYMLPSMQNAMGISIRIFSDSRLEGITWSLQFYSGSSYILSVSEHAVGFLSI